MPFCKMAFTMIVLYSYSCICIPCIPRKLTIAGRFVALFKLKLLIYFMFRWLLIQIQTDTLIDEKFFFLNESPKILICCFFFPFRNLISFVTLTEPNRKLLHKYFCCTFLKFFFLFPIRIETKIFFYF